MPGGRGRATRACKMCKPYKSVNLNRGGRDGRRPHSEVRRAPGITKSERGREARRQMDDEW